jgi:hypothetical protein
MEIPYGAPHHAHTFTNNTAVHTFVLQEGLVLIDGTPRRWLFSTFTIVPSCLYVPSHPTFVLYPRVLD